MLGAEIVYCYIDMSITCENVNDVVVGLNTVVGHMSDHSTVNWSRTWVVTDPEIKGSPSVTLIVKVIV